MMLSTLMRIAVLGAISGTQVSKLQILHYKYSRSTVKCPQKKFFLTFFGGTSRRDFTIHKEKRSISVIEKVINV